MKLINLCFFFILVAVAGCHSTVTPPAKQTTICNPVNISYRFQPDRPSRREAADPTVLQFKGDYYLFASKSGGYWYSDNLVNWTFVPTNDLPVEDYAPTAVAIGDTVYFLASSSHGNIYKTTDPKSGKWQIACKSFAISLTDPALFLDNDQRLYLYWGCSDKTPIYGIQIDYKHNFVPMGKPVKLIYGHPEKFGWEVPGDYNTDTLHSPWIEGAWMNKHNGKYYLQYAGPGTQFKSYSDGVYIGDNPLGPFTPAVDNPFSYKPEGFADGAGHGSTFTDKYGNYWHIATSTISVKHMFERRLVLYPAFFDDGGNLHADTGFGDYPMIMPQKKIKDEAEIFPGWMLLSYKKKVTVSSSVDSFPSQNMVDENIRTFWAAKTGKNNEWAELDLGKQYNVFAVQIDFAELDAHLFGRADSLFYRYKVEISTNGRRWKTIIDKSHNQTDCSQDYTQLPQKIAGRYVRINSISVPGGHFALSGFRVFGKGNGNLPAAVSRVTALRNPNDKRKVQLTWSKSPTATGYLIRFGVSKDKLYQSYQVYQDTSLSVNSLNRDQNYYFTIKPFNENGVHPGTIITEGKL